MREADQDQDLAGEATARKIDGGSEVLIGREVEAGAGREGEDPGVERGVGGGGGEAVVEVVEVRVRVGAEGGLGKVRRQEETSQGKN